MRIRNLVVLIVVVLILFFAVPFAIRTFRGPRVVGRVVTPEGIEMCVVQRWSGDDPYFNTKFVYRKPGGVWKGFYYNHEDDFWMRSEVKLDTNRHTVVFYRTNTAAVTFDYRNEIYIMHRWKQTNREPFTMEEKWCPRSTVHTQFLKA